MEKLNPHPGGDIRAHLIGLKKICFQKIKNHSRALIGRSVSTPRMVILIFRKFCFQPRSPGGLFLRNSGYLFYSKFMRCAPPSVPNIQSQHWYLHLSRDTHENTRASTHSSVPRKMSNPPPDQQIAPRGTRNQHLGQHLGQLCAGETGTSLLPTRGQATADSGRNRSTAGGYDVFAAGQARAAAYQAAYQAAAGGGSGNKGDKDEEGSYSDSSGDVAVERTAVDIIKSC